MFKRTFFALTLVLLLAGASLAAVMAQTGVGSSAAPAVVTFAVSAPPVTFADAEAGSVSATFSWATLNLTNGYRLALEMLQAGDWQPLDPNLNPQPNGTFSALVQQPRSFGQPTYRAVIYDADDEVVDEQIAVIAYAPAASPALPVIEAFNASIASVDANQLANRAARVPVSWYVRNRIPTAHIVFEQVLANGSVVPAELPRPHAWIDSVGIGELAPQLPGNSAAVALQMRVVDAVSGQTYDTASLSLLVSGSIQTPAPVVAQIEYFRQGIAIALPEVAALEWRIRGANYATLEYQGVNGNWIVESWLPIQHNTTVDLTRVAISARNTHQFRLVATDANAAPLYDAAGNIIQAFVQIPASGQSPDVREFTIVPNPVRYGEVMTITYDLVNVNSVTVWRLDSALNRVEKLGENLPAAGRVTYQVPEVAAPEVFNGQVILQVAGFVGAEEKISQYLPIPLVSEPNDGKPEILSFTASPSFALPGGTISVAWNVRNTGVVSLVREDSTGYREVLGEGLPASGSLSIQLPLPLLPEPPYTVNLYLRAVGPADEVVEARTSVDVDGIIELDPLPTEEASDLSPELSDALPPAEATAEPVALLIVPVDPTA
jgi:hypothetical protein